MNRSELIKALGERYPTIGDREDMSLEKHADWLIDTWEPIIRADVLADLREKLRVLRDAALVGDGWDEAIDAVQRLIDGDCGS